jgi:hypothetical protein
MGIDAPATPPAGLDIATAWFFLVLGAFVAVFSIFNLIVLNVVAPSMWRFNTLIGFASLVLGTSLVGFAGIGPRFLRPWSDFALRNIQSLFVGSLLLMFAWVVTEILLT